jgi:molybdenum cofactor biosynthesis protein B
MPLKAFHPTYAAVLTVSDTRTLQTDASGDTIIKYLTDAGHAVVQRKIVTDDVEQIRNAVQTWLDGKQVEFIIITGGTGFTSRDVTPEAIVPLFTKRMDGFGELFRWLSYAEIGSSTIQSRADAGLCGETFVFLLPGSTGAVRLAMEQIVLPQLNSTNKPCSLAELFPRIKP